MSHRARVPRRTVRKRRPPPASRGSPRNPVPPDLPALEDGAARCPAERNSEEAGPALREDSWLPRTRRTALTLSRQQADGSRLQQQEVPQPNRSRLSCGALKKNSFLNLRAPPASSAC